MFLTGECTSAWCSAVQCGAVWCSVLQCVAVCCSVLHAHSSDSKSCLLQGGVCQYVAVQCSVVQYIAACCASLHLHSGDSKSCLLQGSASKRSRYNFGGGGGFTRAAAINSESIKSHTQYAKSHTHMSHTNTHNKSHTHTHNAYFSSVGAQSLRADIFRSECEGERLFLRSLFK